MAVKEAGGGREKEVYLFDVTGRLVGVRGPDATGEVLTYDGAQAVQARTWGGAVAWTAAWGPGVDHLVSVEKEGHEYFALDDGKGSVVGWLDGASNAVVGRAEYTPEGRGRYADEVAGTTCDETDEVRCPRPLDMPFGFHTAYASRTTGLLYFRNRWYSPEANQWLSQDPLDAVDSFNLYAFNGFDSVNFVDPWGLDSTEAAHQGNPPTDEQKKTCADHGLSDADCGDWVEIQAPPPECRGRICGVMGAGPGAGGLEYLGDGIWAPKLQPPLRPEAPRPDRCKSVKCIAEANRALMRFHDPKELERLEPNSFWETWQARQTGRSYFLLNFDNLAAVDKMLYEFAVWIGADNIVTGKTREDVDLQPLDEEEAARRVEEGFDTLQERAFDIASVVTAGAPGRAVATVEKKVDQYLLKATEKGFYPVMERGFRQPQAGVWLEAGDVWKYGTTQNPSTRYTQRFLSDWGLRYEKQMSGTLEQALSAEKDKILQFRKATGSLPPGNKIVKQSYELFYHERRQCRIRSW